VNKFDGNLPFELDETGCPLVTANAIAVMEAKVVDSLDLGSHTLFVGEVLSAKMIQDGIALSYADYTEKKKGKAPKNAPTYRGA
jgi:flavin reductase (DIM6/NTAB) family NADH-FMN oxidoreductase RutF